MGNWVRDFNKCQVCKILLKNGFNKQEVLDYHNSDIDITNFQYDEEEFIYKVLDYVDGRTKIEPKFRG
jgi:hypothetical protein